MLKAITRVHDLHWLRYGRKRCPTEDARDLYRVLAALETLALTLNSRFVSDLNNWTGRHLSSLSEAAKAEVRSELQEHPVIVTSRWLGDQLGLRDAERDAVQFYDAEAIDMTDAERLAKERERDRARKERQRRERGIAPKGERIAQARAADPMASRTTLYRRIGLQKTAKQQPVKARKGGRSGS